VFAATIGCNKPPLPTLDETDTSGGTGGGGTQPSEFVGTWDYSEIDLSDGSLSFMGNEVGTFVGTGTKISGTMILTENPNTYTSNVSFTASLDVTLFGQTNEQEIPVDKRVNTGTWTESNGQISLVDDVEGNVTVLSSSANEIVFTGEFEEQIQAGQGFNLDAISDVEFTLTK
jgi:hypothetical protein